MASGQHVVKQARQRPTGPARKISGEKDYCAPFGVPGATNRVTKRILDVREAGGALRACAVTHLGAWWASGLSLQRCRYSSRDCRLLDWHSRLHKT